MLDGNVKCDDVSQVIKHIGIIYMPDFADYLVPVQPVQR